MLDQHAHGSPLVNGQRTALFFASFSPADPLFISGLSRSLSTTSVFSFYWLEHGRPSRLLLFLLFYISLPTNSSRVLDGCDHHHPDHFEFTSEGCARILILVTDDKPDASGYPEDFASATAFNLTQLSKPGEHTVHRYGCHPRGWYGCAEPKHQQ